MKLYKKEELKYSRLFFDKEPPRFLLALSIFIMSILLVTIIVSSYTIKPYIIKTQGIVKMSEVTYISSLAYGKIEEIYVIEGQEVKKDQKLITISNGQESMQSIAIQEQIDLANKKIEIMNKYEKSLNDKVNHMSNSALEQEYFGYVEYYLSQLKNDSYLTDINLDTLNKLKNQQSIVLKEISSLETQISLIINIPIDETRFKYLEVLIEENIIKIETLNEKLKVNDNNEIEEELLTQLHIIEDEQFLLIEELEELKTLKNENIISNTKKQEFETLLSQKEDEENSIQSKIELYEQQIANPAKQANQLYTQLIIELGKSRTNIESQLIDFQSSLLVSLKQKQLFSITASENGIINYVNPLKIGIPIQQNQLIAEITNDESKFIVETYIPAMEISKVKLNDKVKIYIVGLNTTQYGDIDGILISIDSIPFMQETTQGKSLFFRGIIELNSYEVKSKKDTVKLIKSLPVDVRIIYEQETYFHWFMNLLDFTD